MSQDTCLRNLPTTNITQQLHGNVLNHCSFYTILRRKGVRGGEQ